MKITIAVVHSPFKITGVTSDPTIIDFDKVCFQKGLYRNEVCDTKGDLVLIGYYETREGTEEAYTYSDPVVEETREYFRSAITGLGTHSTSVIRYYCEDDSYWETATFTKYYNAERGYKLNQDARKVLLTRASMWLYADLISEYGYSDGDAKAKEFSNDIKTFKSEYMEADRSLLLNHIQNSEREYMTPTRKTVLDSILNVVYS